MPRGSSERDSSQVDSTNPTGEASMPVATSPPDSSMLAPSLYFYATPLSFDECSSDSLLLTCPVDPELSPQDHVSPPSKQIESVEATQPPVAPAQVSQATPSTTLPEAPSKNHMLHVPSKASLKADHQATSETSQEPTNDDSEKTLRSSRRSLLKGRRDRSKASSMRSRRQNQEAASMEENKATGPDLQDQANPEKRSKASHRLFAFLSCCSSTDVDPEDTAIPAKRTARRPSAPSTQPTPEKPEVNAGDSSTAESKEQTYNRDEKPSATVISDQSPSQVDEERTVGAPDSSQLDGSKSDQISKNVPEKDKLEDRNGSQHEHAATDSQKTEAPARTSQDFVTAPIPAHNAGERSSPNTNGEVTIPAVAETTPKDELKHSSHEEEATKIPVDLPPPPPVPPGKEIQSGQPDRQQQWLLPTALPHLRDRKCLVLDLDETLVHSSFKVLERADFTIPVEIEGQYHNIYVIKRPGVDQFMKRVGELYEVVVFTASVSKYGDPLLDQLDIHNVVHHRLFRDSCYNHQGNYVKDLSQVGRDLRDTIIIDNSPTSYIFHPQHAIPISSWFSDAHDNELLDLIPVLEDLAGSQVKDVSLVLDIAL
ncbi:hypothetical protein FE257_006801 [Aspergillus nanangensis]|uniref:FCP1 homology domain-containing protein n=1 Tax=Aspergillus nanangensis TaxID=2582783 RepID=A0AAD4CNS8_ASPNN|nr:hypothetical protein FE257_006801 [Aspergillus nanangensis]